MSTSPRLVPERLLRDRLAHTVDPARLLDLLCKSPLADIPQVLITPDQISRILRGEDVQPTAGQKRASMRVLL